MKKVLLFALVITIMFVNTLAVPALAQDQCEYAIPGVYIYLDRTLLAVDEEVTAFGRLIVEGPIDTYTAIWDWGSDNNTSVGTVINETECTSVAIIDFEGLNTYTAPGVYTVMLTITGDNGNTGTGTFEFVVVYDAEGGFVTGGGWIDSPEGANLAEPSLAGKANFGFVSKYKKGAAVPTGQTEFQFEAGGLNFHSSNYDWLVVTGSDYAKFKGSGTINGTGDYKFQIWAGDGEPDTFRIKIWGEDGDGNETVVYDNGFNQPIGGGNIMIHTQAKASSVEAVPTIYLPSIAR